MKIRIFLLLLGSFVFCATRVFAEPHEIKKSETIVLNDHAQAIVVEFTEPLFLITGIEHPMEIHLPFSVSGNLSLSKNHFRVLPPDKQHYLRCISNTVLLINPSIITHYFHSWPPDIEYPVCEMGIQLS